MFAGSVELTFDAHVLNLLVHYKVRWFKMNSEDKFCTIYIYFNTIVNCIINNNNTVEKIEKYSLQLLHIAILEKL